MKKYLSQVSLPILLIIACLLAPACFEDKSHDDSDKKSYFLKKKDERRNKMFKDLNLTREQKQKIKKIRESSKEQYHAKKQAMRQAHQNLGKAMKEGKSDDELRLLFNELNKVKSEIGLLRFEQALAIRKILTPEQQKKFKFGGPRHGKHKDRKGKKHKDFEHKN